MRNKKCWWSIWKYDESHHRIGKRVIIEYKSHTCGLPNRIKTWQDDKVIVQQPTTNQNDSTIDSRCCSYAMHNLEITTSFRSSRWGSRIDNTRVWWVFKLHKVKKYILCCKSQIGIFDVATIWYQPKNIISVSFMYCQLYAIFSYHSFIFIHLLRMRENFCTFWEVWEVRISQ